MAFRFLFGLSLSLVAVFSQSVSAKSPNCATPSLSMTPPKGVDSSSSPMKPEQAEEVVVYTANHCSWCRSAIELLESKNIKYRLINVQGRRDLIDEMEKITDSRMVPQIIIKGKHIGGYLSLVGMNLAGELDELSQKSPEKTPHTPHISDTEK